MRTLPTTVAVLTAILTPLSALQAQGQADLKQRKAKKLEAPFLQKERWFTDFEDAKAESARTGKPIFGYFSRSYAPCPFCTRFEKGAIETKDFAAFADDVVLWMHLVTKVEGDPDELFRQKGGSEYPHLAFLDAKGRVLAGVEGDKRDGYSVAALEKALGSEVAAFRAIEKKADSGDGEAQLELFRRRVALAHFEDFDAAAKRLAAMEGFEEKERKGLHTQLVNQEFNLILAIAQDESKRPVAAKATVAMYRKGRTAEGRLAQYYWSLLGLGGAGARDADLLGEAVERLKGIDAPFARRSLRQLEPVLNRLRG